MAAIGINELITSSACSTLRRKLGIETLQFEIDWIRQTNGDLISCERAKRKLSSSAREQTLNFL